MLKKDDLIQKIEDKKIHFYELSNDNKTSIVVSPSLGGRIIGAFVDDDNLLWVNPDIGNDWNAGGHRTWYAPEWGAKSIYAKGDEFTWSVPNIMDPGKYIVTNHDENELIEMKNEFSVRTTDNTKFSLEMTRRISLPEYDLFPEINSLSDKKLSVQFEHTLKNCGEKPIKSEISLWSIIQVKPPGKIFISLKNHNSDNLFSDNYYEKIPRDRITIEDSHAKIFVDGARRYKLGFPPDNVNGKIAYFSQFNEEVHYLILKTFEISDDGKYVDKPHGDKRQNGDAIQIYNHSEGGDMGFAELEAHAPAPYLDPGKEDSFKINILFVTSSPKEINHLKNKLFNVA